MTKREHDAATRENWAGYRMASDELSYYRRRRGLPDYGSGSTGPSNCTGRDLLLERAIERRRNPLVPLRCLRTAPKRLDGFAYLKNGEGIVRRPAGPDRFDIRNAERNYREHVRRMSISSI
jgi:hypothetical protein